MQIANVKGERRTPGNKHANERLRRAGLIPAVVYGHGEAPETVSLSRHDLEGALHELQHVLNVQVGSQETKFLIKQVQYDHLQIVPIHVDLMRVREDERVQVKVPLEFRGEAKGTHEGGVLMHVLADLSVECLLLKIPDTIRVNVGHLNLGDVVHVKELELPEDVKALHEPDDIVAVCRVPRGHAEEVAAAPVEGAALEPELVGRQAKEKPAEEGEA